MADILTLGTDIKTAYEGETDTNAFTDALLSKVTVSRETLDADRDYYVRNDGNDSNDGLSDSPSGAFFTIQKAIDVILTLDLSDYQVTINVGPGTYPASISLKSYLGNVPPLIVGDVVTPANVVLGGPGLPVVVGVYNGGNPWRLEGFQITGDIGFNVANFGHLQFAEIDFAACANYHMQSSSQGKITATGSYSISGGAQIHKVCLYNANISTAFRTVTLTGTPDFSVAYATSRSGSVLIAYNMTFNGSATGSRYECSVNGVIDTANGGDNYFPGDSDGSKSSGGQYV